MLRDHLNLVHTSTHLSKLPNTDIANRGVRETGSYDIILKILSSSLSPDYTKNLIKCHISQNYIFLNLKMHCDHLSA